MKVILNKDLAPLGEEGDVRDVAKGYARNYLYPRGIAVPYNDKTVKLFEGRREAIEARKVQKRGDAAGLKEKLESLALSITMPAGPNGKLYGAVSGQTVLDELAKLGYQMERKRIELPGGANIKNIGKYKVTVKLYENAAAEVNLQVIGQEIKTETKTAVPSRHGRRRRDEREGAAAAAPENREESSPENTAAPLATAPLAADSVAEGQAEAVPAAPVPSDAAPAGLEASASV